MRVVVYPGPVSPSSCCWVHIYFYMKIKSNFPLQKNMFEKWKDVRENWAVYLKKIFNMCDQGVITSGKSSQKKMSPPWPTLPNLPLYWIVSRFYCTCAKWFKTCIQFLTVSIFCIEAENTTIALYAPLVITYLSKTKLSGEPNRCLNPANGRLFSNCNNMPIFSMLQTNCEQNIKIFMAFYGHKTDKCYKTALKWL